MNCVEKFKIEIDNDIKSEYGINDEDFEDLACASDLEELENAIIRLGAGEQDYIFENPYMDGNYLYDVTTKEGYWDFITDYVEDSETEGKQNYLRLEVYFDILDNDLRDMDEYDTDELKDLKIKVKKVGYKGVEEYDA